MGRQMPTRSSGPRLIKIKSCVLGGYKSMFFEKKFLWGHSCLKFFQRTLITGYDNEKNIAASLNCSFFRILAICGGSKCQIRGRFVRISKS